MSRLIHEIRFDVNQEIDERLNKLTSSMGLKRLELARALFLWGLETAENRIFENKVPVYIPLPNSKLFRVRFEKAEKISEKIRSHL